ncbi:MAG: YbeD family protein [bacterium]
MTQEDNNAEGMTFPCDVDIKVFARANDRLEERIRGLLELHLAPSQILSIGVKESKKGNYHSLSCKVDAHSRAELDKVFTSLTDHPDILMVI